MRFSYFSQRAIFLIVISGFLFVVGTAQAQFGEGLPIPGGQETFDDLSAPSVEIVVSASGPVGSTALLRARTDNVNDNNTRFDWYLDDQLAAQSGRARIEFSFQTTKPFHLVRLVVLENGQKLTENTISVASFNVALAWHADTFVPAEYEGKALPSVDSRVTIVALPEIRNENPDDLLYTWYVNSESQIRWAVGEQEFSFRVSKNTDFVPVMVEVSTQSQSILVRAAVNIPVRRPQVILYQSREKELIAPRAYSYFGFSIKAGDKIYFYAKPFYFHAPSQSDLIYEWRFAGKTVMGIPPDPSFLTLSIPPESGAGLSALEVLVENPRFLGETASTKMEVQIMKRKT